MEENVLDLVEQEKKILENSLRTLRRPSHIWGCAHAHWRKNITLALVSTSRSPTQQLPNHKVCPVEPPSMIHTFDAESGEVCQGLILRECSLHFQTSDIGKSNMKLLLGWK